MIGTIQIVDEDTHRLVKVQFHKPSLQRGYRFKDYFKYTQASLGPCGALYACQPQPATETLGLVHYRPFNTWANSPGWSVALPEGEAPVAICAGGEKSSNSVEDEEGGLRDLGGSGHVVIATSRGMIRFLLGTGIQTYVWHIGGEVVTMVAGDEWVFIVHREGGPSLDGM